MEKEKKKMVVLEDKLGEELNRALGLKKLTVQFQKDIKHCSEKFYLEVIDNNENSDEEDDDDDDSEPDNVVLDANLHEPVDKGVKDPNDAAAKVVKQRKKKKKRNYKSQ